MALQLSGGGRDIVVSSLVCSRLRSAPPAEIDLAFFRYGVNTDKLGGRGCHGVQLSPRKLPGIGD